MRSRRNLLRPWRHSRKLGYSPARTAQLEHELGYQEHDDDEVAAACRRQWAAQGAYAPCTFTAMGRAVIEQMRNQSGRSSPAASSTEWLMFQSDGAFQVKVEHLGDDDQDWMRYVLSVGNESVHVNIDGRA